jgi:hypothetical protein
MANIEEQKELLAIYQQQNTVLAETARLEGEIVTKRQQQIDSFKDLADANDDLAKKAKQAFDLQQQYARAMDLGDEKRAAAINERIAAMKEEQKATIDAIRYEEERGKLTKEQADLQIKNLKQAVSFQNKSKEELEEYIKTLRKFNIDLDDQTEGLEEQERQYKKMKKGTDALADSFGGLLGVQRNTNAEALGSESFFGLKGKEAVRAQVHSLGQTFQIMNLTTAALKGIVEQTAMLMKLTAEMSKATGMSREFASEVYNIRDAGNELVGAVILTNEEVGAFQQTLYETLPAFSRLDEEGRTAVTAIGSLLGQAGVDAHDFSEAINQMAMTTGLGVSEAGVSIFGATEQMNMLGITPRTFMKNLAGMTPQFARFGKGAIDILKKAMVQAKALNVEVDSLIGSVEGFETFEDASQKAAMLNATMMAVGASTESMVDAMDMVMTRDPTKKFEMLRAQYHELQMSTGMTFREMAEDQGKFGFLLDELVDQSGKSAQEFINMFDLMGETTLSAADKQKNLTQTIIEAQTPSEVFAAAMQKILPFIQQLALYVSTEVVPAIASFVERWGPLIKGITKGLALAPLLTAAFYAITTAVGVFSNGMNLGALSLTKLHQSAQTTALTVSTVMGAAFGIASGFMIGMTEDAGALEYALGAVMAAIALFPIVSRIAATGVRAAMISTGVGALIVGAGALIGFLMEDSPEEQARKAAEAQEKQFADMEKNMAQMKERLGIGTSVPTGGMKGDAGAPWNPDTGFTLIDPPSFHKGGTAKLKSGEIIMTSGPGTTDMSVLNQATVNALSSTKGGDEEKKELAKEIAKALEPIFEQHAKMVAQSNVQFFGTSVGGPIDFDIKLDGRKVGKAMRKGGAFNEATSDHMGI